MKLHKYVPTVEKEAQQHAKLTKGKILSWDQHPKFQRRMEGKGGRSVAIVEETDEPDYVRLMKVGGDHWYEFAKETLLERLEDGSITLEDPKGLLNAIKQHYEISDPLVAEFLTEALELLD